MVTSHHATYSHLQGSKAPPSEYDIVTSRLLYYVGKGFEVDVPIAAWYQKYQTQSWLQAPDWEAFADPRFLTYTKYTQWQTERERALDALFERADSTVRSPAWLDILNRSFAPLRYPFHGLHMVCAYVGHMAPCGRITMTALFQCTNEMRRIERIAYRIKQLEERTPSFGADGRSQWQDAPAWQPLREAVERLLVAYDWGDALVGLNVCLKPAIDDLVLHHGRAVAQQHGDPWLVRLWELLEDDALWQREWTEALVRVALGQHATNGDALQEAIAMWQPRVRAAVDAFAPWMGAAEGTAERVLDTVATYQRNLLHG